MPPNELERIAPAGDITHIINLYGAKKYMRIIALERGKGKTEQAIKMAAEGFYYLVCFNNLEARYVKHRAKEMGLDIPMPITHDAFLSGRYCLAGIKGFVIDDFDTMFRSVFSRLCQGRKVEGITIDANFINNLTGSSHE